MADSDIGNQYLTFVLNAEDYAISIVSVREVLTVPKMTRIPRMPDFMRGVINLRGSVVPILDLRMKFGLGETSSTPETAIIVLDVPCEGEGGSFQLGVLADSVRKVISILPENVEPAPRIGMSVDTSFIIGMGRVEGDFAVILNIKQILTQGDLRTVQGLDSPSAAGESPDEAEGDAPPAGK